MALLILIQGAGPRVTEAFVQPDQEAMEPVSLPFVEPDLGEYFEVHAEFALSPLHTSRFIVAPDDCLEILMVNDQLIPEATGKCGYHAGHAFSFSNLQRAENTLFMRIHNTGGPGGADFRMAWTDPLVLLMLILALVSLAWAVGRILMFMTHSREISLVPFVIALALLIRFLLVWHDGYGSDLHLNKEWGFSAMRLGVVASYSRQLDEGTPVPNYPPLNIVGFAAAGLVYEAVSGEVYDPDSTVSHAVIKWPAIIADLITVVVLFMLLSPLGGRRKALAAAAVYAINPAVFHDSTVWGQTDALFTLFLCVTLLFIQRRLWAPAGAAMAVALLFKAQAIVLIPVLAAAAWLDWRRWVYGAGGGLLAGLIVLSPFFLQGAADKILDMYRSSVGYYTSLSLNAHNLWVMLYTNDTGRDSTQLFLNLMSYRNFGIAVWFLITVSVLWLWRHRLQADIRTGGRNGLLMLSGAVIAYAFFIFNAEMHERYLFPYLALGLPLLLTGRHGIMLYLATSFLFLLNLLTLVTFGEFDNWLVHQEFNKALPVAVATAQVIVFFATLRHIHQWQRPRNLASLRDRLRKRMTFFLKRIQNLR